MPINQELLARIEESADDWGPTGVFGNDPAHARHQDEPKTLDGSLGLQPISIRLPKELLRDLKAIAQLNEMGYQPLIRAVCQRFVDAEKRAITRDRLQRRQQEIEREREQSRLAEEARQAAEAAAAADAAALQEIELKAA